MSLSDKHNNRIVYLLRLALAAFAIQLGLAATYVYSQEVDFGSFVPDDERYSVHLYAEQNLEFGMIISGQTAQEVIDVHSGEAGIVAIEGVSYLDVFVNVVENPEYLWLDGVVTADSQKRIPLQLKFAYSNTGEGLSGSREQFSGTMARFPVRRRDGGPPGPPPTPPHSGYEPPRSTAYLLIGGILGDGSGIPSGILPGYYRAQITLEVTYDI